MRKGKKTHQKKRRDYLIVDLFAKKICRQAHETSN